MQQLCFVFSFSPVWQRRRAPPQWWLWSCCSSTAGRPLSSPAWAPLAGENCAHPSGSLDFSWQPGSPEGEVQTTIEIWTSFITSHFKHHTFTAVFLPLCRLCKWIPTGVGPWICSLTCSLGLWLELSFFLHAVSRKEINADHSVGFYAGHQTWDQGRSCDVSWSLRVKTALL